MKSRMILLLPLILLVTGCGGGGNGSPVVEFMSPASGDTVAEGEAVTLVLSATEDSGDGIARVEVFVNGALLTQENSPSGSDASFNFSTTWVAGAPGGYNIMAIAYSGDGTASAPATIILTVDGSAVAGVTPAGETATPAPEGTEWVQGEASEDAYIRTGPGLYCDIIEVVDRGTIMNLMEYSASMQYLMTDVLGPDDIGWVWVEQVDILGDESLIPRGNKLGCLGCGDGTCSPEAGETCATCEDDCGACCGNGACEGGYGESCYTCATDCGACCGDGVCDPVYGETCTTCETDCGPCCGNGVCEAALGETCLTCMTDCGLCFITFPSITIIPMCSCGNGICQAGCNETTITCCTDCGSRCGDGVCNCGESYSTCSADCIG